MVHIYKNMAKAVMVGYFPPELEKFSGVAQVLPLDIIAL
jgi:hypothetical protein